MLKEQIDPDQSLDEAGAAFVRATPTHNRPVASSLRLPTFSHSFMSGAAVSVRPFANRSNVGSGSSSSPPLRG